MNRLGMLVDISHVNDYAMMDTLDITLAPGKYIVHTSKLVIDLKLFPTSCQLFSAIRQHLHCVTTHGMSLMLS